MPELALRVRGLGKAYRVFVSPRERLREALHPFGRRYGRDFAALAGVDFELERGLALGVIGRNGSGKSTLLQILAGVLEPTSGEVERRGRVAALLELGAGFNPELTGRQNVVMHGALIGRSTAETRARLPEIEAFADIGEFIDQPVRTYSSGMFARLAFATAIDVDPDILIVDEILAVGDACFQERCFTWLRGFRVRGKTLVLVSHDLEAIATHCDRALLLEGGKVAADGEPRAVANRYVETLFRGARPQLARRMARSEAAPEPRATGSERERFSSSDAATDDLPQNPLFNPYEGETGGEQVRINDVLICDASGVRLLRFASGESVEVHVKLACAVPGAAFEFGFGIYSVDGAYAYGTTTEMRPELFARRELEKGAIVSFPLRLALQGGHYFVDLAAFQTRDGLPCYLHMRRRALHLEVTSTPYFDGLADLAPPAD